MEMVACIILTDIQAMAPYMMIIMVTAFGAAVAAARDRHGQVLAREVVPVAMVGVLALGHAQVVAEVVAHLVEEVPVAALVVAVIPEVVLEAVAVREVMAAPVVVTDNLAKAAFFKV
ncbi:hypothetical protein [Acetobacter pasteurianus]|uniref:hypothetical protein n=1 Tax=Acetobacter pasteurianus TaxID=438 RepID=UPI003D12E1B2